MVTRLDSDEPVGQTENTTVQTSADASAAASSSSDGCPPLSIQQQLENAMRLSVTPGPSQTRAKDIEKKLDASIKAEMAVFESSGKRGRCLEQAYNYLLSIPPSSVEAERAFSSAGALCTKLRSRLSDNTLDTLCFLRAYYRNCK